MTEEKVLAHIKSDSLLISATGGKTEIKLTHKNLYYFKVGLPLNKIVSIPLEEIQNIETKTQGVFRTTVKVWVILKNGKKKNIAPCVISEMQAQQLMNAWNSIK